MPILNVVTDYAGLSNNKPITIYVQTNDTQATVLQTGYFNSYVRAYGQVFNQYQMALIYTTDQGVGWYEFVFSGSNTSVTPSSSAITNLIGTTNRIIVFPSGSNTQIDISPNYVGQTSINRVGVITAGTWEGFVISGLYGGTGVNNGSSLITIGGNLTFSGAFNFIGTITGNTNVTFPTSGTLATTAGASIPSIAQGDLLYGSAVNVLSTLAKDTNATRYLSNTGSSNNPAWAQVNLSNGVTGTLPATSGGTGQSTYILGDTLYASAANTLSKLAGNTTSGIQYLSQTGTGAVSAAPIWSTISGGDITGAALTKTDDTNVTLTLGGTPTTALLRAASLTLGWTGQLGLTRGGTNASLTADNGGIVYSTASALAILASTATARQMLQSGASATPAWSTTTWPATTTANRILYSSSTSVIGEITSANSAVLVTNSSGVPAFSSTMTNGQVIIGSTGSTPVAASLTAGSGVTITPGAGTITISATGSGGTVTSVSGTANQIDSTGGNTPVLSLSSTAIFPGTVTLNADPTTALQAATKQYVDAIAAGLDFKNSCVAATTAALTVTYSNGAAGIGATLTNAGTQAAFSIDGQSPTVTQRVLIKNQASAFQNGIYTVTVVGTGASNWILTRSLDYDQASEIAPGDLIPVTAGTVNADTLWLETATVTTIGSDSISFSQFSSAPLTLPVSLANGGTGAALTASNGGIFYSNASTGAILAGTATAGKVLQSGASTTPSWSTPTYPSASGTAGKILRSDGTNNVYTTSTFADTYTASNLLYSNGANTVTGLATANSAVLVTNSSGVPAWSGTMTNGQVIIGSTSATPTAATLTAGTGITITNGAASITIASSASSGAWTKISSQTASNSATIDFTGLDSTYIQYKVELNQVIPVNDADNFYARVGTGGTPTYQTTTYAWSNYGYATGGSGLLQDANTATGQIILNNTSTGLRLGNDTGESYSGSFWIFNPSQSAKFQEVAFQATYRGNDGTDYCVINGGGGWATATAVTALRFLMSSGNISSGTFTLYGLTG